MSQRSIYEDLRRRELVQQDTPGLAAHLEERRTVYVGFDPTAESLHIGSLVPLIALRRMQLAGHHPIALIGGATGLVGDPSFKAVERQLNPADTVESWSESIRFQVTRFLAMGGEEFTVVNNLEWLRGATMLDFLRDVGKHFSVSAMIRKDSVRQRIERDGDGISFTEFSYALLQAYDFTELNRRFGCTLQIGGSDQWGNIIGGIDLCRRQNHSIVHALTLPLVTKADGSKFGKTESGSVWLDPSLTSAYSFFQFWMGVPDSEVYRYLRMFTFVPVDEIQDLQESSAKQGLVGAAQRLLAEQVTELVHGRDAREAAVRITGSLFDGRWSDLVESDYQQLRQDGLTSTKLSEEHLDMPLTSLLTTVGLTSSGKQAKDALARQAVLVNQLCCGMDENLETRRIFGKENAAFGKYFLVRLGKKSFHLFMLS